MPRTLGKDKSQLPRGLKPGRVGKGVCGQYLIAERWKWDADNDVFTVVHDSGEKLIVMFVFTWELDAVMKAIQGTVSFSKHLALRLLREAVFLNPKPRLWVKGLVRPHTVNAQVVGVTEEHAERLPRIKVPWVPDSNLLPVPKEEQNIKL